MDRLAEALQKRNGQTPAQEAKVLADIRLRDSFNDKQLKFINFVAADAQSYLTDYFILHEDMHSLLNEEYRRCYGDYSFIVLPIHKAFESYTAGVLSLVFRIKIDEKVPLGSYLKIEAAKIDAAVSGVESNWKVSLNADKWKDRWNSLAECWTENRNPLIHVKGERIETLRKAENVAATILREIELSSKLFNQEFYEPVLEAVKKIIAEEQVKKESGKAV